MVRRKHGVARKVDTIPAAARTMVRQRDHHRCARCGTPAPNGQWHHRRTRAVVDLHQHCACNGVWLCATCHRWAHANPVKAREAGVIVSRYVPVPAAIPIQTWMGERYQHCNGNVVFDSVTESEGSNQ